MFLLIRDDPITNVFLTLYIIVVCCVVEVECWSHKPLLPAAEDCLPEKLATFRKYSWHQYIVVRNLLLLKFLDPDLALTTPTLHQILNWALSCFISDPVLFICFHSVSIVRLHVPQGITFLLPYHLDDFIAYLVGLMKTHIFAGYAQFSVCCGERGRAFASHTDVRGFEPQCGGRLSSLTCWQL